MSKERARTREQRQAAQQALLAQRQAEQAAKQAAEAQRRHRRERRALLWRRVRLWQHGSQYKRNRERWAALGTLLMCVLLVTYLFTWSLREVLVVALICVVASPVLIAFIVNRKQF
ncbi:hypothetical protein SAMN05892883_3482 [Jatrophihabitans sp. GAS493]|uniref:hypothetical protein n=1 Tax=Jatrophihabitans sp. GAS493 TaxID=1907575 RepID=UPI000BB6D725|nr:hypothetical protein [Jatrophihabitans sp. GAS493]SOD74299.1 hypothetical protein SAMN05892883_3482 [Jatrophihabitans sp. GAS493]